MQDNYIPYGPEWEKEISKLPKAMIIGMLKKAHEDRQAALVGWKVDMGRAREAEKEAGEYRAALERIVIVEKSSPLGKKGIGSLSYLIAKGSLDKYPQPEGRSIDQMDF